MRTLSSATLLALASGNVALAQLIELDLDPPWFVNTTGWELILSGQSYIGMAGAGRIDTVEETPGEIKALKFELPAILDAELATAMAGMPQGRGARLYTAVFDPTTYQIIETVLEWAGRLDVPQIAESEDQDGKASSVIQVTAEHIGIDLLRPSGLLYSNADQERLYPGDRSFEYVIDQSERHIVWPAASYFRK